MAGGITANRVLGYRGRQIIAFIKSTIASEGQAPSYTMIYRALDMTSRVEVCKAVARLEKRGLVRRVGKGRVRRIRLPTGS